MTYPSALETPTSSPNRIIDMATKTKNLGGDDMQPPITQKAISRAFITSPMMTIGPRNPILAVMMP
jgi:hypothetical protein